MATHPDYPNASSVIKKGKVRWRYRANRHAKEIQLRGEPGSPEFDASYEAAAQGVKSTEIVTLPGAMLPQTFAQARRLLEASSGWEENTIDTQINKTRYLNRFLAERVVAEYALTWGETPVRMMDFQQLDELTARIKKRDGANVAKRWLEVVNDLIFIALRQKPQWISYHPGFGLTVKPKPTDGHRPWPREVREQFEAFWPLGTPARTCYELAYWLGNRRSDITRLTFEQRQPHEFETSDGDLRTVDAFVFRQKKNSERNGGREMFLPVLSYLDEALKATGRGFGPVLRNTRGGIYSDKALTGMMEDWTRKAGLEQGYTMHGLRKTLGNRLAELGLSARQIMEVLGHTNLGAAEIYVRQANKKQLTVDAFDAVEAAEKRRRLRVVK